MENLSLGRRVKRGRSSEEGSEGVLVRGATVEAHSGVKRKTFVVRAMPGESLNEFVIVEDGRLRNKVQQSVSVRDVWDFNELRDKEFGEIYAIAQGVGMDLFQLLHNRLLVSV